MDEPAHSVDEHSLGAVRMSKPRDDSTPYDNTEATDEAASVQREQWMPAVVFVHCPFDFLGAPLKGKYGYV